MRTVQQGMRVSAKQVQRDGGMRISRRQLLHTGLAGAVVLVSTDLAPAPHVDVARADTLQPRILLEDNPVLVWAQAALQAIRDTHAGPPMAARALAIVHTCMYDAWAAYDSVATATRLGDSLRQSPSEQTPANKRTAISFEAPLRMRSAEECVRFERESCGAFGPPPLASDEIGRRSWLSRLARVRYCRLRASCQETPYRSASQTNFSLKG